MVQVLAEDKGRNRKHDPEQHRGVVLPPLRHTQGVNCGSSGSTLTVAVTTRLQSRSRVMRLSIWIKQGTAAMAVVLVGCGGTSQGASLQSPSSVTSSASASAASSPSASPVQTDPRI